MLRYAYRMEVKMRNGLLCLAYVLLLSCGKAENAPSTSTKASNSFGELPSPATDKQAGVSSRSAIEPEQPAKTVDACMVQDGLPLGITPIRAVGTEPFWGARIEGRCVQYSHMEDQKGTRVWTQYTRNEAGEIWLGALNGKAFELRLRNKPGCSDGMSDKRYPYAVELKLGTELRQGCAEAK